MEPRVFTVVASRWVVTVNLGLHMILAKSARHGLPWVGVQGHAHVIVLFHA